MLIGFSTGCFYKTSLSLAERIRAIKDAGSRAIELNFLDPSELGPMEVEEIRWKDFASFSYISCHAPAKKIKYGRNRETRGVFEKIRRLNDIRPFNWVVIHPDVVDDFRVFRWCGFNVAIENMDNRKKTHKTPEELVQVLEKNPEFGFVLDVNHVFSNNPDMRMAKEFYRTLGHRICEIHLSGYCGGHDPLFETKQTEIIQAIENFETPIIVESALSPKDTQKEIDYVTSVAKKLQNRT